MKGWWLSKKTISFCDAKCFIGEVIIHVLGGKQYLMENYQFVLRLVFTSNLVNLYVVIRKYVYFNNFNNS